MPQQDHAALRDALRAEASRHTADRAAMLARMERGMAVATPRRARLGHAHAASRRRFRLAGTVAAISAALALSVAATWAAVGDYRPSLTVRTTEPAPPPETGSPTSSARPTATPSRTPSGSAHSAATPSATAGASGSAFAGGGTASEPEQGFLWSDGSVDPHSNNSWAQSDVTLKNRGTAITALEVRLWVALTPGVTDAGSWTTLPGQDVTVTVSRQNGGLLYDWRLRPGAVVAPGTYEFAGQYAHAQGGRDAGRDGYQATATGADGSQVSVQGNFYRTR